MASVQDAKRKEQANQALKQVPEIEGDRAMIISDMDTLLDCVHIMNMLEVRPISVIPGDGRLSVHLTCEDFFDQFPDQTLHERAEHLGGLTKTWVMVDGVEVFALCQ